MSPEYDAINRRAVLMVLISLEPFIPCIQMPKLVPILSCMTSSDMLNSLTINFSLGRDNKSGLSHGIADGPVSVVVGIAVVV